MTDSYQIHHSGFISIVGRPNVGKSTLLNRLVGQKLSITSRKPQTTRHRIMGVDTHDSYQAMYVDTPGLHIEKKRTINRLMNRTATSALTGVELVLFLVDGTQWTEDDQMVLNKLKKSGLPTVLLVNKVDNIREKGKLFPHLQALSEKMDFIDIVPVSAKKGTNVDVIKKLVRDSLPEGEWYFPKEYVTDRSQRFMASEIIREKLMRFLGDELPYAVTVEIERFDYNSDTNGFKINGLILVERNGQKRMIIGKGGDKIKIIGREARLDMETMFERKVYLELWIKVKSGWADDVCALRGLGYIDDL
ncbi:GTPase Era [Candidatus Enterovibrio altilux]|uniref:GTPase Era n=1 Tax=Candidatus Enterovibrio altilux TaxID=1927128 RepID=A0A291B9S1_9GAMM|nr:GTPase Era [Candidatus Enterovibrio luxaltus]ATF09756.1 GTP-binding protein Era [Candidatus Enterovibrio luxaltus]